MLKLRLFKKVERFQNDGGGGGWDRNTGARKKRGRTREKTGRETGCSRWWEPREIDRISQNFFIKMGKEARTITEKGWELGAKGTGSWKVQTARPRPPPPPPISNPLAPPPPPPLPPPRNGHQSSAYNN